MSTYNRGDYVKVEFLWMRVSRCDDAKKLVIGTLDSEPLNDYDRKIALDSDLVVSYSQIREHRKSTELTE